MNLTLFIPCFVDLISPQAGISIVNILEGLGHQIDYPDELGCCGDVGLFRDIQHERRDQRVCFSKCVVRFVVNGASIDLPALRQQHTHRVR